MTKAELINMEYNVVSRIMRQAALAYVSELNAINSPDLIGSHAIAEAYAHLHAVAQAEAIGWASRTGEG